jgi:hypothetical protein
MITDGNGWAVSESVQKTVLHFVERTTEIRPTVTSVGTFASDAGAAAAAPVSPAMQERAPSCTADLPPPRPF